jgi:hypothetical protein
LQMARSRDKSPERIAAAYYRAGQNDEALHRLAKESADKGLTISGTYFLAMAQHVAGQLEEARQHLDQANQSTEAFSKGRSWNDQLMLELLRSEAETLLTSSDKKE